MRTAPGGRETVDRLGCVSTPGAGPGTVPTQGAGPGTPSRLEVRVRRADLFEKTLILGMIEGRRRRE